MMQETKYFETAQGKEYLKRRQEFFKGTTKEDVTAQMDKRLAELQEAKHELVRRVELDEPHIKSINRNAQCPRGSGHKYVRCCRKVI